jgi:hypothetical protein
MTSGRTPIGRPTKSRITPEAVALFKRARALYDQQENWEEDGGRRREYLAVTRDLHSLMGRYPHQEDVCATIGEDEPPEWMANDARRLADYRQAVELRRELEKAAKTASNDKSIGYDTLHGAMTVIIGVTTDGRDQMQ